MLLHELGHVARRDYLAQACAQLACALYWFDPLVWVAAHRMRIEREHACDDLVVRSGHEAARYADDLVRLARSFRPGRRAPAAAIAIARPDRFRERLMAILDEGRNRHPVTRRRVLGAGSAALAAALVLASLAPAPAVGTTDAPSVRTDDAPPARTAPDPERGLSGSLDEAFVGPATGIDRAELLLRPAATLQQAAALCGPGDGEARRRASMTNDDVRTIEAEYGDCRSSVRIEGEVDFTEDFSALERLSPGAFLRIEVRRGRSDHRLEARPGPGGRPELEWTVDGSRQPVDETARRWLADALLDLFRSSSYMAEERAAWILAREGPEGLLAEVELMLADHAKATYLALLLEDGRLSGAQVRSAIAVAGREIGSDHSLGEVLMAAASAYDFDAATRTAFLEAAASIGSDHTQGRIYRTALARGGLSQENLEAMLANAAESIGSDHTLGEILSELASRYPLEPRLREPFLRAAATIDSDHTAGRVYGVVLEQPGLRPDEIAQVLDAAAGIGSDHTLGELLRSAAASHDLSDPTLRAAFLRAASTIGSDHTRASVFRQALELEGLSQEELATILGAATAIGSDHELSTLLVEMAGRGVSGPALQRAYLDAAAGIGSDHAKGRALSAFLGMDDVGDAERIELLAAARTIGSDHTLAELLVEFAGRHPVEGAVREAFLEALDTIQSRHDHGRVSSALVGGPQGG